jgi:type I pantothenate kinase
MIEAEQISPYLRFSRTEWATLRASTPLPLTEKDLSTLRGINEEISLDEVAGIYLPLSRLLNLYVSAIQSLHKATDTFLGHLPAKVPYIIGIAGSVAVGKSTMARILQALLSRWPDHPKVDLITTDGFLYPTAVLEKRGLMNRKGFPESYDQRRLVRFLTEIKSGKREVSAPVYSHLIYDIVAGAAKTVCQPDVLIVEGLNVLQSGHGSRTFVSDFFDFSIYIDAEEETIENWYVARFLKLRETVFRNPESYFNRYSKLTKEEATAKAHSIWREINGPNLHQNIQPTRERAQLILRKGAGHSIEEVRLRKL